MTLLYPHDMKYTEIQSESDDSKAPTSVTTQTSRHCGAIQLPRLTALAETDARGSGPTWSAETEAWRIEYWDSGQ